MTSARTAEYYLLSVTEQATFNENNFNLPQIPSRQNTNVITLGQKYFDIYLALPTRIRDEATKITKLIAEEVIRNIFEARTDSFAAVRFRQGIPRFQKLQFRLIDMIKEEASIEDLSRLNKELFADLEAYLVNNPGIFSKETQSGIIEIIHLLRNYEIEMKDLILHRKEELQDSLKQLNLSELDEFMRAIYGPYLVITCVYVYLKLREKDAGHVKRIHLTATVREGFYLANQIDTYFTKIKELIKPLVQRCALVFPEPVKSYMSEQRLDSNAEMQVRQFLTRLDEHLHARKLGHEIAIDMYIDVDDPDWKGIKIILSIEQDLKAIYDKIKPVAYSFKRELPKEIAEKILIQFN